MTEETPRQATTSINQRFAGSALLMLLVDDLAARVAELADLGITVPAVATVPGLNREAVVTDPEGNSITFGESLSAERCLADQFSIGSTGKNGALWNGSSKWWWSPSRT